MMNQARKETVRPGAASAPRILIVEDESDLALLLGYNLESEGYVVENVARGDEAELRLAENAPDLVILDWMLPGVDGLTVCRELRRKHLMPILMLTARGDVSDRVTGLQVGADDYLAKPFSIVELSARVGSLLRRVALDSAAASSDSDRPITFGTLVLDPIAHRATLAGSLLDISRREMDLLELLLQHPGRTFSRDFLLERLWGADFEGLDRAVDTQIVRLRRKLGNLGACIETVWGIGYRFRPDLHQ
jgi:DNA-binding response OmpR family regulator